MCIDRGGNISKGSSYCHQCKQQEKLTKEEKLMIGGAILSKDVPFSIDAKGGEKFC